MTRRAAAIASWVNIFEGPIAPIRFWPSTTFAAIALDNVGAGQSSFSLPRNLPIDTIKIDPELIQTFDRDNDRRAVFAATIALAHEARLTAVAVGIETRRQLALARELDCSVGQGFLLHQPAPADAKTDDKAA